MSAGRRRLGALLTCLKWPEADGSAAGVRTAAIVAELLRAGLRVTVTAAASAESSVSQALARRALEAAGARTAELPPNDSERFRSVMGLALPGLVVFDRLACEEMFSHAVRAWADAEEAEAAAGGRGRGSGGFLPGGPVTVLDMQDAHSVRAAREAAAAAAGGHGERGLAAAMAAQPRASSVLLQREMSAVRRSDCVWAVSDDEADLVRAWEGPRGARVRTVGFAPRPSAALRSEGDGAAASLEGRSGDAVMIGTMLHAPNVDSVRWAVRELWPAVASEAQRRRPGRPPPRLHVFGSHMTEAAVRRALGGLSRRQAEARGVLLRGHAPTLAELGRHRLLFAPLRFGAGVKGKVLDAWEYGTPVVTTPVGAEGLVPGAMRWTGGNEPSAGDASAWPGHWRCLTAAELVTSSAELLTDDAAWCRHAQRTGVALRRATDPSGFAGGMGEALELARDPGALAARRACNMGQVLLWQSQLRATAFMSRMIEGKHKRS